MMIFLNTLWPIEKFLCSCADRRAVKRIRETCFIYIPDFWSELVEETLNTEGDLSRLFQLLKLKRGTFRLIFLLTLFPLLTDKFSWKPISFTKAFVRRSMWDHPCRAWVLLPR